MLPKSLVIENFTSFASAQTLDFSQFETLCIVGENGAGKSSILEALCWALWGKTKMDSDSDIIHLGAKECSVVFEFYAGETLYRVVRKRAWQGKEKKRAISYVDFLLFTDDEWKVMSGPTVKETNEVIEKVIGISYELFIHSSYLRQGKADLFVSKTAAERKAVLAELLGLEVYEKMHVYAKEQLRLLESQKGAVDAQLQVLSVDSKEEMVEKTAALFEEITALGLQEVTLQEQVNTFLEQKTLLSQLDEYREEKRELGNRMEVLQQSRKAIAEVLDNSQDVVEGFKRYERAVAAFDSWQEKERLYLSLQQQIAVIEKDIARIDHEYDLRLASLEAELDVLQSELDKEELHLKRKDAIEKELEVFVEREKQRAVIAVEREKAEEKLLQFRVIEESTEKQIAELEEKVSLLSGSDSSCPTCDEHLGDEKKKTVLEGRARELKDLQSRLEKCQKSMKEAKSRIDTLSEALLSLEKELVGEALLQQEFEVLTAQIADLHKQEKKQVMQRAAMDDLLKEKEKGELAQLQKQKATYLDEITLLGYSDEVKLAKKKELDELLPFVTLHKRLAESEQKYSQEKLLIDHVSQAAFALDDKIVQLEKRLQSVGSEELSGDVESELIVVRETLKEKQGEYRFAQKELERIDAMTEQLKSLQAEKKNLVSEISLCEEIVSMYSKNGMQAMLIEQMVPEFERLTNIVIGQLTEGRMSVSYELTKLSQSGDKEMEAFEIYVDHNGQRRSVSTYSGGEAFRLHFAIRVALSQLQLSFRAKDCDLLIVDEGFGSQDSEGIELLAQSLRRLSGMFEKVIVISHMDAVKEAFDTKVLVSKGSAGSVLEFV